MIKLSRQHGLGAACLCMAGILGGCTEPQFGNERYPSEPQHDTTARRFQEPETSNATLIESAVELSDKYAKLSAKTSQLQQLNQDLQQENGSLKAKVESLEMQLKQVDAQLDESNRLVMDLNGELQMWKKDILGFRSEMRAAAKAQINALMKIMSAMGVEKSPEAPASEAKLVEPAEP